jgi:hypothetical protein
MLKKIKQLLCNHSYNYWGHENLYASVGDEFRKITTPVHTMICRHCGYELIIWDRRKQS